ncbi:MULTISPECIES: hypothetical protein [Pseudomonas]|jgi:hypothetical protein|uniref:Uncharacterized protein n=1 Tax=Pseudomonas fluorescens TaxID=294 RepID=A0AAE2A1Y9_PSEFL|nr:MULTISPECIES: hypothetical protein [Pseudomonas]KIF55194.1 hypothetical protein QS95_28510 [Pseudomonas fluorescens]
MTDIESGVEMIGDMPEQFEALEDNVHYRVELKGGLICEGVITAYWDGQVWSATIQSIKEGHRTFRPEDVVSITSLE